MCTALSLMKNSGTYLFGRNMDIEYYFGQKPMIIPRNYAYKNLATGECDVTKFALIGMGLMAGDLPLFAEVQNEKGLACAGLNFPDAVWENECKTGFINMPPYNFPLWVTANFENTDDFLEQIGKISLVAVPVSDILPLPTLHFMVCDKMGKSVVIEVTKEGVQVYGNPVGVMTNAPDFPWHMTNLRNYINLSNNDVKAICMGDSEVIPLGTGTGYMGISGDFSSVSRFVRAAIFRNKIKLSETKNSDICGFFHILDNVAMIKGTVTTLSGHEDYTSYSSCMDLDSGLYYYKTYGNINVRVIDMFEYDLNGNMAIMFPYEE